MKRRSEFWRATAVAATLTTAAMIIPSAARGGDKDREMSVQLTPYFAHAPATVQLRVHVLPRADNRRLRVTLDSGEYLRSSDLPLEGDRAAASHSFRWPSLPSGNYVVFVELIRSDGQSRTIEAGRIQLVGLSN